MRAAGTATACGSFFALAAQPGEAGILEQALLAHEYRDVFRVTGAPGMIIPLVAAMARLLGRRLPEVKGT